MPVLTNFLLEKVSGILELQNKPETDPLIPALKLILYGT